MFNLIIENKLIVYADRYLLSEVHTSLIEEFDFTLKEADVTINLIIPFVIIVSPKNIYRLSIDVKYNFLYDICIQNNCRYLITIDKELIKDKNAPFLRKTDSWLKRQK